MKALTWPNHTGERRDIPGVPSPKDGWGPGVMLPLSDIGISETEAQTLIDAHPDLGLALEDMPTKKAKGPAAVVPAKEGGE